MIRRIPTPSNVEALNASLIRVPNSANQGISCASRMCNIPKRFGFTTINTSSASCSATGWTSAVAATYGAYYSIPNASTLLWSTDNHCGAHLKLLIGWFTISGKLELMPVTSGHGTTLEIRTTYLVPGGTTATADWFCSTYSSTGIATCMVIDFDASTANNYKNYGSSAIAKIEIFGTATADTTRLFVGQAGESNINVETSVPFDETYVGFRATGGRAGVAMSMEGRSQVEIVVEQGTLNGIALQATNELPADAEEVAQLIYTAQTIAPTVGEEFGTASFKKALKKIGNKVAKYAKPLATVARVIPGMGGIADTVEYVGKYADKFSTGNADVVFDTGDWTNFKSRNSDWSIRQNVPIVHESDEAGEEDNQSDFSTNSQTFYCPGVSGDLIAKIPLIPGENDDAIMDKIGVKFTPSIPTKGRSYTLAATLAQLMAWGWDLTPMIATGEVLSLHIHKNIATLVVTAVAHQKSKNLVHDIPGELKHTFLGFFPSGITYKEGDYEYHGVAAVTRAMGYSVSAETTETPADRVGPTYSIVLTK